MGTNVYLIPHIEDEVKKQMYTAIELDEMDVLMELIPEKIHIGKRSAGWQFLFDFNKGKYYDKSRKSLDRFFETGQLINEYEEKLTIDQFWKEYVDDFKDGYTQVTYLEKEDKGSYSGRSSLIWEDETFEDGLRWSAYTNFG
jgi:hypothetical protein